jgi:hypothetical protein
VDGPSIESSSTSRPNPSACRGPRVIRYCATSDVRTSVTRDDDLELGGDMESTIMALLVWILSQ